jgi:hypothetical protein
MGTDTLAFPHGPLSLLNVNASSWEISGLVRKGRLHPGGWRLGRPNLPPNSGVNDPGSGLSRWTDANISRHAVIQWLARHLNDDFKTARSDGKGNGALCALGKFDEGSNLIRFYDPTCKRESGVPGANVVLKPLCRPLFVRHSGARQRTDRDQRAVTWQIVFKDAAVMNN